MYISTVEPGLYGHRGRVCHSVRIKQAPGKKNKTKNASDTFLSIYKPNDETLFNFSSVTELEQVYP